MRYYGGLVAETDDNYGNLMECNYREACSNMLLDDIRILNKSVSNKIKYEAMFYFACANNYIEIAWGFMIPSVIQDGKTFSKHNYPRLLKMINLRDDTLYHEIVTNFDTMAKYDPQTAFLKIDVIKHSEIATMFNIVWPDHIPSFKHQYTIMQAYAKRDLETVYNYRDIGNTKLFHRLLRIAYHYSLPDLCVHDYVKQFYDACKNGDINMLIKTWDIMHLDRKYTYDFLYILVTGSNEALCNNNDVVVYWMIENHLAIIKGYLHVLYRRCNDNIKLLCARKMLIYPWFHSSEFHEDIVMLKDAHIGIDKTVYNKKKIFDLVCNGGNIECIKYMYDFWSPELSLNNIYNIICHSHNASIEKIVWITSVYTLEYETIHFIFSSLLSDRKHQILEYIIDNFTIDYSYNDYKILSIRPPHQWDTINFDRCVQLLFEENLYSAHPFIFTDNKYYIFPADDTSSKNRVVDNNNVIAHPDATDDDIRCAMVKLAKYKKKSALSGDITVL
jgi:hypothetical protein